jgi:peroxiredoxin
MGEARVGRIASRQIPAEPVHSFPEGFAGALFVAQVLWVTVIVGSLIVGMITGHSPRQSTGLSVGSLAPELTLPSLTEPHTPYSLAQTRDRVIVLAFWSSRVLESRGSLILLDQLHRQFQSEGVSVIAVALEAPQDVTRVTMLAMQLAPSIDHLHDPGGMALEAYQVVSVPSWYVIGRDGRIRARGGIPTVSENVIQSVVAAEG